MESIVSCRGTCQSVTSHSASRTMMCTKSLAEGRRSPFLLSRGTCLYPVWEHKVVAVSDEKKENMKSSLCSMWIELSMLNQQRESSCLSSFMKCENNQLSVFLNHWVTWGKKDLINISNITSQLLNSPIFKLLNGSVYCPTNSLSDTESWSSTTKRTSARSGTYTSNWKFSFHAGLNPTRKHGEKIPSVIRCFMVVLHHSFLMFGAVQELFSNLLTCFVYFKGFPHFPECILTTPRGCDISYMQQWFYLLIDK